MDTVKSFKSRVAAMDAVKSFRGYGKVDAADDQAFRRKARNRLILISVSAVLLLAIIVGVAVTVVVNRHTGDKTDSSTTTTTTSSSSTIKAMCAVTRYPDSCFSSISSMKGSSATKDPEELVKLALRAAAAAISKVSTVATAFSADLPTNDTRLKWALRDCKELFDDAIEHVNASLASMDKKLLSGSRVDDLKTWLSAAVADQETCLDGFEGTTAGFKEKMDAAMVNSTQLTSNGLAIVAGIVGIMDGLGFPVHRRRKLLLLAPRDLDDLTALPLLPAWASDPQRRALLQAYGRPKPNVTVAADGSGDVKTIQEAVGMVPKKSDTGFVIYVKAGEYRENVVLDKSKWNVIIYGDGMFNTLVVAALNFIDGTPTFSTATFAAVGKRFMAMDMGFKNTAGPEKHQAVALRSDSDQSIFYRCSFDAFQDTLYAHSLRQFYRDCDISGTVDFIFGDAAVVFQKCNIRPRQPLPNQQNIITAQGRKDPNENTGISIQGCTITPYDTTLTAPTYLGRPWKDYSRTVIMQSTIGSVVHPSGWLSWVAGTAPPATIMYAEFQNSGPGSSLAARVNWPGYRSAISAEEADKFTVDSFINGKEWIAGAGVEFESSL